MPARCRAEDCPAVGLVVLVDDDGYNCTDCDRPLVVDDLDDTQDQAGRRSVA